MRCAANKWVMMTAVVMVLAGWSFGIYQFNDGETHELILEYDDYVFVDMARPGMGTTVILMPSGAVTGGDLVGYEDSRIELAGGSVSGSLIGQDRSQITLYSGLVDGPLEARGYSIVNLYGGTIGGSIVVMDSAELILHGIHFEMNGQELDFGELDLSGDGGTITVIFQDDTTADYSISASGTPSIFLVIPEPATLGLMTLGVVLLRKRRIS